MSQDELLLLLPENDTHGWADINPPDGSGTSEFPDSGGLPFTDCPNCPDGDDSSGQAETGGDTQLCDGLVCGLQCCDQGEVCIQGWCVTCDYPCTPDGACFNDSYCLGECCVPWGTGPMGQNDDECLKELEPGEFRPSLQCEWTSPEPDDPYPNYKQVLGTPIVFSSNYGLAGVAIPWIAFVGYHGSDGGFPASSSNGYIRILNGKNCEMLHILDMHEVVGASPPAAADLDGDQDNMPEIVAMAESGGLVAFKYSPDLDEWSLLWHSTEQDGSPSNFASSQHRWAGPTVVDLDGSPGPEILVGGEVFTNSGVRVGTSLGWNGYSTTGQFAVAVDVDLDGAPELITGDGIYAWTGQDWAAEPYFTQAQPRGYVAISDFGDYPVPGLPPQIPEIVLISAGKALVMALDGTTVFGPYPVAGGGTGGPPTVGDFDNDGEPEFALASKGAYQVFDFECATQPLPEKCSSSGILWSRTSQDYSSSITGSSVFDFEGDGKAEAVYADECFLRVYDGETGEVTFSRSRSSCTWNENPVIADTDADFRAEIVVGSNTNCSIACPGLDPVYKGLTCMTDEDCPGGPCDQGYCRCNSEDQCLIPDSGLTCATPIAGTPGQGNVCRSKHQGKTAGIRVFRDFADHWVASRTIWNQHVYYVTNVNDDGTVPLAPQAKKNWLEPGLNTFRQNTQGVANPLAAPDATAKPAAVACDGQGGVLLYAELCNRGAAPLAADTPVSFYDGSPDNGKPPVCTGLSTLVLLPKQCEVVACNWSPAPTEAPHTVMAIADDTGNLTGETTECQENNNIGLLTDVWCP